MAKVQKAILTEYANDGSVVMSNIRKGKTDLPTIGSNETYSATLVTEWYDGSPMDDSKADGAVYLKYKGTEYPNYTGSYFRVNLPNDGELFLEKDTVAQLRAMSAVEILLLKMGYYKGVTLNGYYKANDTPGAIQYYLSDTEEEDDGGSVFVVGGIKLEHEFVESINPLYFGAKAEDSSFDNRFILQNVFNKRLEVVLTGGVYYISGRLRLYNSIRSTDNSGFKIMQIVGTRDTIILDILDKKSDEFLYVEGLNLDGSWDGETIYVMQHSHGINIEGSDNVVIKNNVIKDVYGDCVYVGISPTQISNNVEIVNNIMERPYRCNCSVTSGDNIRIINNKMIKLYPLVAAIDLEPNRWCTVSNILVEGNTFHVEHEDNSSYFINLNTFEGAELINLNINGNRGYVSGMFIRKSPEAILKNIDITNNIVSGERLLFLTYVNGRINVLNNIDNTRGGSNITGNDNITIIGNKFHGKPHLGVNPSSAISLWSVNNSKVINNEFDGYSSVASGSITLGKVTVDVETSFTNFIFSNNTFVNGGYGVGFRDVPFTKVIMSDNIFLGTTVPLYITEQAAGTDVVFVNNSYHTPSPVNSRSRLLKFYNLESYSSSVGEVWANTKPTTGSYERGNIVKHPNPTIGQDIGWRCIEGGSPGTWVSMGVAGQPFKRVAASADIAEQAAGATPTKAEFDALLAELRDLKTKMRAGSAPILSS